MSVWLHEKSWDEVKEYLDQQGEVLIIPVGSTEQHGSHLPTGTDTMVAIELAQDAAAKTQTLVAPPLWYGWSPHHMVLPGTITVRAEVLLEVLYDVIESLSKHGFTKFVAINGHRIVNIPWMQIGAERAQRLLGVKVVIFDPSYMAKEILAPLDIGPVGHAEEVETSHLFFRRPDLVKMSKAMDNPAEKKTLYSPDPGYKGDTLCYVPLTVKGMQKSVETAGGVTGRPSKSSQAIGEIYHRHLVDNLVRVIEDLKTLKP